MGDKSGIEWTDATVQPVRGCNRVSPECLNCYAERLAATRLAHTPAYTGLARMTDDGPRWTGKLRLDEEQLRKPLSWERPRRIFVCSMSDLFHDDVPFDWVDKVLAVACLRPQHIFQLLTKRAERMAEYFADPYRQGAVLDAVAALGFDGEGQDAAASNVEDMGGWPPCNVWVGVSAGDRDHGYKRLDVLAQVQAQVRWASVEPLLEGLDLARWLWRCEAYGADSKACCGAYPDGSGEWRWNGSAYEHHHGYPAGHIAAARRGVLSWVVAGGESGPGARAVELPWARHLRDQCRTAGVPFLWKQWGQHAPPSQVDTDTIMPMVDAGAAFDPDSDRPHSFGKSVSGRLLDGQLWDQYPSIPCFVCNQPAEGRAFCSAQCWAAYVMDCKEAARAD